MDQGALFIGEDYLGPMERCACACPETGWSRISGCAAPVYLKTHSWGEFVFDFAFANAYAEHGLNYYPKLLCAVPFTPVPGPRLCGLSGRDLRELAEGQGASSAHVLFLPREEAEGLRAEGWLLRQDLRFVWRNRGYADFDEFLAALASKKRKNIRAERRRLAGLDIRWQRAQEFDRQDWEVLYQLYASTYAMRGQRPYLSRDCLMAWARSMGERFLFCIAREADRILAMAFFFSDEQVLYGRHWGSREDIDGLHFELCYYRGIEYCIEQGLVLFDAGVQGGHRLLRGFEPELTYSAHDFADPRFQRAIGDYLGRERELLRLQLSELEGQTAFRKDSRISSC